MRREDEGRGKMRGEGRGDREEFERVLCLRERRCGDTEENMGGREI